MTKSFKKMWWRVSLFAVLSMVTFFICIPGIILLIILQDLKIALLFRWYLMGIAILGLLFNSIHLHYIAKIRDCRVQVWRQAGKDDNAGFNLKLLKQAVRLYCQTPY